MEQELEKLEPCDRKEGRYWEGVPKSLKAGGEVRQSLGRRKPQRMQSGGQPSRVGEGGILQEGGVCHHTHEQVT